jgi:GWxTD domain-containing protein
MIRFYLILMIIIISSIDIFSQIRDRSLEFYYDFGKKFNMDYFCYPADSQDSINIIIFYRYNFSYFSYEKTVIKDKQKFIAISNLLLDVKDENGIIKKSISNNDTLYTDTFDETRSKTLYKYNYIKLTLKKGVYSFFLDLNNSKFEKIKSIKFIKLNLNISDYLTQGKTLFVQENIDGNILPFVMDSSIAYNNPNSYMVFFSKSEEKDFSFNINLKEKQISYPWTKEYRYSSTTSNLAISYPNSDINFESILNSELTNSYLSKFNLKLNRLKIDTKIYPGNYSISISKNNNEILKTDFNVIWEQMPLSLKNPEYAVELMYYILNDDEFNKMSSGRNEAIFTKILEYWKAKDPTPETNFNEKMFTYFSRVDYAFFNFQTINEKDGAKTERGKIYILYGQPDKIDRKLGDSKTIENWIYSKLNKEFSFETTSNGSFILKNIK